MLKAVYWWWRWEH